MSNVYNIQDLITFGIEIRLKDTIASLPKKLRKRLPLQYHNNVRRGESTVIVPSHKDPALIDELLKNHGRYWDSVLGTKDAFTMIARFKVSLPSWMTVISVPSDSASPYAAFFKQLIENIAAARKRGIATNVTLFVGEVEEKHKRESAEAEARLENRKLRAAEVVARIRHGLDPEVLIDQLVLGSGWNDTLAQLEHVLKQIDERIAAYNDTAESQLGERA